MIKGYLRIIKEEKGAVAIEMAFVIIGFVLLLTFITDFGVLMLKNSKLERVSASAASVFREREALYTENNTLTKYQAEQISQVQTDKLGQMAVLLMGDPELSMRVDAVYFADGIQKNISKSETFYFTPASVSDRCAANIKSLDQYAHLSPYSGFERWMPLYRITVCIPGKVSLYKFITNSGGNEKIVNTLVASNITIPR